MGRCCTTDMRSALLPHSVLYHCLPSRTIELKRRAGPTRLYKRPTTTPSSRSAACIGMTVVLDLPALGWSCSSSPPLMSPPRLSCVCLLSLSSTCYPSSSLSPSSIPSSPFNSGPFPSARKSSPCFHRSVLTRPYAVADYTRKVARQRVPMS